MFCNPAPKEPKRRALQEPQMTGSTREIGGRAAAPPSSLGTQVVLIISTEQGA